jgi:large subunit ribosomal protein L32e
MSKELIILRNSLNKRRPNFYKQSSHKKKKLDKKWRKARGSDSKIKIRLRNRQPMVDVGYRGPVEVRGLSKEGFNIILVNNVNELKNVNKTKDSVCIAGVGIKKKVEIVKECLKLSLHMINVKDAQKFLSEFETDLKKKKEEKTKKQDEKSKKSAEKKDKKEGIEEKIDKAAEKKEKDMVLTKREI